MQKEVSWLILYILFRNLHGRTQQTRKSPQTIVCPGRDSKRVPPALTPESSPPGPTQCVFFTSCLSRDSLTVVTVLGLYYHLRKHMGQRPKCCVYKMYHRQCLMSNIILL